MEQFSKEHNLATLRPGRTVIVPSRGVFVMAKHFPWQAHLKEMLMRSVEAGINERIVRKYMLGLRTLDDLRKNPRSDTVKPFSMDHFAAGFMALTIGVSLALAVLMFEASAILRTRKKKGNIK